MWRWLFKPEVLFLGGSILGIMPYWMWAKYGPNYSYRYPVTYIPMVFWITGYVAFWLGAKLAGGRLRPPSARQLVGRSQRIIFLTTVLIVALLIQCLLLMRVYGGIPILRFISDGADSLSVDELATTRSFVGQLALYLTSQFLLDALILLLLITAAVGARRHRLLLFNALVMMLLAGIFAGKRQTIALAIVIIGVGAGIWFGHPLRPFLQYLGFRRPRWTARMLMIAGPTVLIIFLGIVATLRSGFESSGRAQVSAYLQVCLINFETQAGVAGYGPSEFAPLKMLKFYVPDRVARKIPSMTRNDPPRTEPTAPAGFYGDLHWNVGLPGAILFAFCVGFIAKYFYLRAPGSLFHLLVYSLMSWTLMTPFLYNHFLHANFLFYPSITFWLLLRVAGIGRPNAARPHVHETSKAARTNLAVQSVRP